MNPIDNATDIKYSINRYKFTESNGINIIHINIQSIRNKSDEIEDLITTISNETKKKIHIIALSEIWIYANENKYFNINGYNAFFSNRNNNRSGGCCIYIANELESTLINEFEFEKSNFVIINVHKYDLKVACVYRYGKSDILRFNEKLESEIYKFKKVIMIGDININLGNNDTETREYINSFKSNGMSCLNNLNDNYYTRRSNMVNTFIDHILSNIFAQFYVSYIDSNISDHRIITVSFNPPINSNYSIKSKKDEIKILNYENIDREIIQSDINNEVNINNFDNFHEKIINLIDRNTTSIKKRKLRIRKPWADVKLIQLINTRDKFYKKMLKSPDNETYLTRYKQYKIEARNKRNQLKKNYYDELLNKNINNNKKTWNIINSVMYNKEYKEKNIINQIEYNNVTLTIDEDIANAFNSHFIESITVNNDINFNETPYNKINRLSLYECTEDEINSIISKLRNNASNGYDGISAKFIKKYKEKFKKPLTELINKSLKENKYPNSLKIGAVIPIYKNGDKKNCSNYRPITKLSTLDKIFEQVLLNRLQDHLIENNIIDKNQFGFIKNSNTLAACVNCTENIYNYIENGKFVALLTIDLKKAFDSTNLEILFKKLEEVNIVEDELKMFKSFLENRKQFTIVNNVKSKTKEVKIGVPQGSKLAATLFIIFINGILKLKLRSMPQFYADDGLFIFNADTFEDLLNNMNNDLELINKWFEQNHLKLNISKTKVMLIEKNNYPEMKHFIGINFHNELIKKEKNLNYLGLVFDEKLNWNDHVEMIKNKLIAISAAIFRIRKSLPKKQLWKLYHAHFISHLNYLNPIWNVTSEQNIKMLQRLQNKIIKLILNKPRLTASASLYKNRMNIKKINHFNTSMLIQKIKQKTIKCNLNINTVEDVQSNFLRNIMNLRPKFFKKQKCKSSIFSNGLTFYNKIPLEIRDTNMNNFKKKLKEYLIYNCIDQ